MSEKMTSINLPGGLGAGWQDWGEHSADEMIAQYRQHAERMKAEAEEVLAASDEDFQVRLVRGPIVQHLIRELQPGRPTCSRPFCHGLVRETLDGDALCQKHCDEWVRGEAPDPAEGP